LHRKPAEAKSFYAVYCSLIAVGAVLVLIPGVPLGLLTNAVQTLAGVLLPSASVFLLLLCNDKQVLGPWVNGRVINMATALIVGVLVVLSIVLTAAVAFPDISGARIVQILAFGVIAGIALGLGNMVVHVSRVKAKKLPIECAEKHTRHQLDAWRMPPLDTLQPAQLTASTRIWMGILRIYLLLAMVMVGYKVFQLAR
jgi:hypothetical protein